MRQDPEVYYKPLNQLFSKMVGFYFTHCSTTNATITTCLLLCYCTASPSPTFYVKSTAKGKYQGDFIDQDGQPFSHTKKINENNLL